MLFLTTGIVLFAPSATPAQPLKPGEIIYSRAVSVPGGNCDSATIWAVGQDGSNDRLITHGLHPRISPDGRLILFKRFDPSAACGPFGNGPPRWWIRDLTTNQETNISNNFLNNLGDAFSPETKRGDGQIMFDDKTAVCRMNLDGTNRFCNFFAPRMWGHLSIRGGDSLVAMGFYDTNFPAVSGISTFTYDFANLQKIPNTSIGDLDPAWSNDGQTIAFASFPGNRQEPYFFTNLFKINPDGSSRSQLTFLSPPQGEGFTYSLVWTLDNSTILNAAKINGVAGIYKISANGGGILGTIPITPGAAPEWVGGIAPAYGEQQTASFGGGVTSGGTYTLVDTLGQAFAGQTSSGGVFNLQSGFWTNETTRRSMFDFDGDGKTDISIFRPSGASGGAEWWYRRSSDSQVPAFQFGTPTDIPVPADFTGDGKTDAAIWRPSDGRWFILRSEDSSFFAFPFGSPGDIPMPADYDGDGKADPTLFRPSSGTWFISRSSDGQGTIVQFGVNGDQPVASDYDGDGKADIGIFRHAGASGGAEWWIQRSTAGSLAVQFGSSTDKAVPGDYTGDGKTDLAFWRPSDGRWFVLRSEDLSFFAFPFGASGDLPVPGDYDGDGICDAAIFRPSQATWFISRSTAGVLITQFGAASDHPLPGVFVR